MVLLAVSFDSAIHSVQWKTLEGENFLAFYVVSDHPRKFSPRNSRFVPKREGFIPRNIPLYSISSLPLSLSLSQTTGQENATPPVVRGGRGEG